MDGELDQPQEADAEKRHIQRVFVEVAPDEGPEGRSAKDHLFFLYPAKSTGLFAAKPLSINGVALWVERTVGGVCFNQGHAVGYGELRMPSGLDREVQRAVVRLRVNGEANELLLPVHKTLLEVLREDLGLTGTKHGCELGECGTCTVLVDGSPQLSCLVLPLQVELRAITTIEGLAQGASEHPLQASFTELGAAQCGYCTPGMLLAAKSLLDGNPHPTRKEVQEALAGNLCRCTGYAKILEAVDLAAARMASP
jgi:carbon-monoxide dehydrogenase small subunit